jgi:DNA-binding transcriptional regulator of glucitol operon
MNHTLIALVAVLAAAALVIGAVASPAFADSSKTITKQANKQKQVLSGFVTVGDQHADNCIAVLNDANACREQGTGAPSDGMAESPG